MGANVAHLRNGRQASVPSSKQGGDRAVSAEAGEGAPGSDSARPGDHVKISKDSRIPLKDFKQGQPEGS